MSYPASSSIAEELTVLLSSDDSNPSSPCDDLASSFASITSSVGPLHTPRTENLTGKGLDVFYESSEDEEAAEDGTAPAETTQMTAERQRRERLRCGPTRANRSHDRQSILSAHQNRLNEFILRESKAATTGRQDHQIMLRQLVSVAYFRDSRRAEHRQAWRRIMAAIGKEYYGSKAIFSFSPDPYDSVVAKLSSMMLWDEEIRHWNYGYCDAEVTRRRTVQRETLAKLQESGTLFL